MFWWLFWEIYLVGISSGPIDAVWGGAEVGQLWICCKYFHLRISQLQPKSLTNLVTLDLFHLINISLSNSFLWEYICFGTFHFRMISLQKNLTPEYFHFLKILFLKFSALRCNLTKPHWSGSMTKFTLFISIHPYTLYFLEFDNSKRANIFLICLEHFKAFLAL